MRLHDGALRLSASDLMAFMGCRHRTRLDHMRLYGEGPEPADDSEDAALLQAHGDAHEQAFLERLRADGRTVVAIDTGQLSFDAAVAETRAALEAGPDIVFQGALAGGAWGGYADFLERVEEPSALGPYSYEVADTKLKRTPDPKHVLQLVLYSDLLAAEQGRKPERAHLELGTGERATLRLQDFAAYARLARERLEEFIAVSPETPMQLPQVAQGAHPGEAGLSCLEYLLGDGRTVAPERGIFLPASRRMHRSVCRFVSEQVYDGRLQPHEIANARSLAPVEGLPPMGAHLVEIAHEGNTQSSEEEAKRIAGAMSGLLGATFTAEDGASRPLTLEDILVVAPYNAQVNLLRRTLPEGARVGTVDKFQGQEAPVCLVSLATSSADEIPRGLEFLFSLHRLNVAVSRAQVLALVFASPALLETPCSTVEQMRLVNALCALREQGNEMRRESNRQL